MRNYVHSSIKRCQTNIDKWLNYDRCCVCSAAVFGAPWCVNCLQDLKTWAPRAPRGIDYVDQVYSGFEFSYPLDKLIHRAKADGDYRLLVALGVLTPSLTHFSIDTVIYPVPISQWQLLRRGFNQASILAREVNRYATRLIDEVSIYKHWNRPRQSTLDRRRRTTNAEQLFGIKEATVAPHAVIVDDVITTGATIRAIAKLLRKKGARRVDAIALASVP